MLKSIDRIFARRPATSSRSMSLGCKEKGFWFGSLLLATGCQIFKRAWFSGSKHSWQMKASKCGQKQETGVDNHGRSWQFVHQNVSWRSSIECRSNQLFSCLLKRLFPKPMIPIPRSSGCLPEWSIEKRKPLFRRHRRRLRQGEPGPGPCEFCECEGPLRAPKL